MKRKQHSGEMEKGRSRGAVSRRRLKKPRAGAGPLPFLYVNMAMTADGKITTANRAASGFSSERDQRHLLELRASADAVMAGARTVDLNPVNLGPGPARYRKLRVRNGFAEYNLRIVVSGRATLDPDSELFRRHFSPIILLTTSAAPRKRVEKLRKLGAQIKIGGAHEIDFPKMFRWLRKEWNVKRLLCEGGGEVNDALFRAGLVDELHLTISPKIFGGRKAPTICDGIGIGTLAAAARLKLKSARRHGDELFLVYGRA